jgi:hypothetical protein
MSPAPITTAQLEPLIARIAAHQKSLGLNDERFVGRYQRFLSSTRTWKQRLLARDFTGLKLDKWMAKLTSMVTEIDSGQAPSVFYETLPFVRQLSALSARLDGQINDRRCVVALAPTGCGKSTWAKQEVSTSAGQTVYCSAVPTWRDNNSQIYQGLARALGAPEHSSSVAGANAVTEALKSHPRKVIIDDAHEGGICLFRIVRGLIDHTKARFILLAYPTYWDMIRSSSGGALDEANQLFGRCIKPVFDTYRGGVSASDVAAFLKAASGLNGEAKVLAERIAPLISSNGNLRVLADALEEATAELDDQDKVLSDSPETLVATVQALCPPLRTARRA